jgi:hypothetical protein
LLVLPWVVAWLLVRHRHLDIPTTAAVVAGAAAASAGFPVAWLTWAMYRDAKKSASQASDMTLADVADQLAVAVGAQWEAEAAIRRLNDPYPLPVSWDPADASLTDDWQSLVILAETGAGWPAPPPEGSWAAGPDGLAGGGSDLVSKLAAVPTGRLVVLGEPGAGKTMLMVRLVLDLLAHRAVGGPVPILASIASWNPAEQDLRGWLAAQLMIDHPALAAAPPADRQEPTQAAALLASGLILMVLDGLDEIPEEVRGPAISRINYALRPGEHLVLACRTRQYQDAVRPVDSAEVTLQGAAAVQLKPLDAEAVRAYLCPATSSSRAKARWAPVLAVLGTAAPAGQALETPLMVGLARAIYSPRPGELVGQLRNPAELCDPGLTDRAAVEALLFDAFIPAAYRHDPADPWKAQDAEKWLVFLARHLEYEIFGPDLAWWELRRATLLRNFAFGSKQPSRGVYFAFDEFRTEVAGGLGIGLAAGLLIGALVWIGDGILHGFVTGFRRGLRYAWLIALVVAIYNGFMSAFWQAFKGRAGDIAKSPNPQAVLARDRRAALVLWLLFTVVFGLVAGILALLIPTLPWTKLAGLCAAGFAVGFALSLREMAWPIFGIVRASLALRHRLPWHLMGFLADAHKRGVLRQTGAVYQFRHIELQHRLATRPAKSAGVPEAPGSGQ